MMIVVALKCIRSQKHPAAFIRQLTNFELKGKKAGIVVICPSRLVSGKEEEDPWKSLTKEEKWPFYEIVDRDIYAGKIGPRVPVIVAKLGNSAGLLGANYLASKSL